MLETIIISVLLPITTGLAGWFGGKALRKKEIELRGQDVALREQEARSKELENTERLIEMWRDANNALKNDNTDLKEKLSRISAEYDELFMAHKKLSKEADSMRNRILKLEKAIERLSKNT